MDRHAFTLNTHQGKRLKDELEGELQTGRGRPPATLNAATGAHFLEIFRATNHPSVVRRQETSGGASCQPPIDTATSIKAVEISNKVHLQIGLQQSFSNDPRSSRADPPAHVELSVPRADLVEAASSRKEEEVVNAIAGEQAHTMDNPNLERHLGTSVRNGLDAASHASRLAADGPNRLTPPKKKHWILKLGKHFVGGFQLLMLAAAVLCFIVYGISLDASNLYLGVILVLVVTLTGLFAYYQTNKSENLMEKFNTLTAMTSKVIRNGQELSVNAEELVVGDLVVVVGGERVPADLVIVASSGLKVNNSSLTGECEPLTRTVGCTNPSVMETKNVAFCGTFVVEGSGKGIVFQTGDHTVIGQVAQCSMGTSKPKTHLKQEIKLFVQVMAIMGISLGIIFLLVSLFAVKYPWQVSIVFCIGIIVANVPEGLLPQLTVQLYITAKLMAKKNVMAKNLEIIETLGCVSCIASDKTGTLTQNLMTVSHLCVNHAISTAGALAGSPYPDADTKSSAFGELLDVAILASFVTLNDESSGNPTERAVVKYFAQYVDVEAHRTSHRRLADIPFNSNNKFMLTVCAEPASKGVCVYLKGAPERVMQRCSTVLLNGREEPMASFLAAGEEFNKELGRKGERVLGFARRRLDPGKYPSTFLFDVDQLNFPTEDLCFIGLVSLIDPPRDGVQESIAICKQAGVRVMMVTGDHPITAEAIARNIGILLPAGAVNTGGNEYREIVVNGEQLLTFTDADWHNALSCQGVVFARTLPQQKQMIVAKLQERGEMVAVTGDGVNDSPALKQASCGVAMGIMGSEIAKDAADVILLDDNFTSIIAGIQEGRLVFANMQKCILYTMIHWAPEVLPTLLYVAVELPASLTTAQMLTIDLFTDMLPAIAVAWEPPETEVMHHPPRKSSDRLTSGRLFVMAFGVLGVMEMLYAYILYFLIFGQYGFSFNSLFFTARWWSLTHDTMTDAYQTQANAMAAANPVWQDILRTNPTAYQNFDDYRSQVQQMAQTGFLASIVISQIVNMMCCRLQISSMFTSQWRNWRLWLMCVISFSFNILLTYSPVGWVIFGTRVINFKYYGICFGSWPVFIVFYETMKWCIRRWPTGVVAFLAKY